MSTNFSSEYVPTILNSRSLLNRLAIEILAVERDCKAAWPNFKQHPVQVSSHFVLATLRQGRRVFLTTNVTAAVLVVASIVLTVMLFERTSRRVDPGSDLDENQLKAEATIINLNELEQKKADTSIGRGGKARVGLQNESGEGSGEVQQRAGGGGGGGQRDLNQTRAGKLPPPSGVLAAIPKTPPVHPPTLPVAGIDIDPALWKDLKAPVYGDPRSNSQVSSSGPGTGGGMGTNEGLGIGEGKGPGFGPGNNGNMGENDKQIGCCGKSGGNGDNASREQRILKGNEVDQRAKLLLKPEPQYTEEARKNLVTGTVTLKVIFSSTGQVEQIHAVHTLPFGLTEKAIAAARQIRFLPAMSEGHPVSVWMQLEYNFNLY